MSKAQRALLVALLTLAALAAGCMGGTSDAGSSPGGGDDSDDVPGGSGPGGNGTGDGPDDGNQTGGDGDGNETAPDDDPGAGGNGTGDNASAPQDYGAAYNGTVSPGFSESWAIPVNATPQQVTVAFSISGDPLPGSPAHIHLVLTDANGTAVREGNVTATEPTVEWTLTGDEAAAVGEWTLAGEGNGISDENLGGARYELTVGVAY